MCGICWLNYLGLNVFSQQPELVVQIGHTDDIRAVAFSPDGRLLASCSGDDSIILWDVASGKELRAIESDTLVVNSVAFSPDGKTLASAGPDGGPSNRVGGIIKLWDIVSGKELKALKNPEEFSAFSVRFSPDGKRLVSVGDKTITMWNVESGQIIGILKGDATRAAVFSPDGRMLATAIDNVIKLWDDQTGRELKTLSGHNFLISSLVFSPDNKKLASAGLYDGVKLWNIASGKEIKTFSGNSVEFSPDGKLLALSDGDSIFKLLNISTWEPLKTFSNYTDKVESVRFSPDGKIFASIGDDDNTIKLWDVITGQQLNPLKGHSKGVGTFVFSPDGKTIAWDGGSEIKLWNITNGQSLKTLSGHTSSVYEITFSPDGRMLATGSSDKTIKLWDLVTGKEIKTFTGNPFSVIPVTFSRDGKMLASGSENIIKLWDINSGQEIRTLIGHTWTVWSVAFSPDGKILASGSWDGTIKLWDVATGILQKTLKDDDTKQTLVTLVRFSDDGKFLASHGSTDKLWDVDSGKILKSFGVYDLKGREEINTIVPNFYEGAEDKPLPNSRFTVGKSKNGRLNIYESKTAKLLASLVAIDNNDWLVVTPNGFFDGTSASWSQLNWRFNNNTFDFAPIELYFNDFFYPNLLQDVLAGKSPKPKPGSELEKIDRRQPKVEIAAVNDQSKERINSQFIERTAVVSIEIADNNSERKQANQSLTSGAQDLRLFRNGSLVKIWHGNVFELGVKDGCQQIAKPNEVRRAHCRVGLPVVAGVNNFTAYAFNSQNVKSNDDVLSINGSDSLKRDGTLYVLAIGVNKYENSALNLSFAVLDVEEISATIKSQQAKLAQDASLKQYARTEIITLKDETATKKNILLALKRFSKVDTTALPAGLCTNLKSEKLCAELKNELSKIKPTEPEDALIIQFSGHGTSRGQRFYLLPHNFTNVKDLDRQGVSDEELNRYLEKVDAGRLLMVIDACQSGQALGEESEGRSPMNSKGLAQLAYDKGMLILTAAQSQQAALELVRIGGKEIKHGLLTYALLEAMKNPQANADRNENQQLSEREWFDFAVEQVPLLQTEAMKQRRVDLQMGVSDTKGKRDIIYLDGDDSNLAPEKRRVQTPRVFYRRESEKVQMIIAQP